MIEKTEQPPLDEQETRDAEAKQDAIADTERPAAAQSEAPQAEEELDDLQTRVRGYSEKKWNTIQYVLGAAAGFLCGALMTYFSTFESIGMYGTIGALVIAIFLPRLSEKRVKRSVQKGRIAMMISLAVWIAATALIMIAKGVPFVE